MTYHYIEEIVDEIDEKLPKDRKRIKKKLSDHHSGRIEIAYLFEEKEKNMSFFKRTYKFFFPLSFHEDNDKYLVKAGEGMNIDYVTLPYIWIKDKDNRKLEEVCQEVSKKYRAHLIKDK